MLTEFQEPRDISGDCPPPTSRKATSPLQGCGPWSPWSTSLPLPPLRFPINRHSRSVLWHQIHSRWGGREVVPSEAAVNDSRFSVGSCYGKFMYAGKLWSSWESGWVEWEEQGEVSGVVARVSQWGGVMGRGTWCEDSPLSPWGASQTFLDHCYLYWCPQVLF